MSPILTPPLRYDATAVRPGWAQLPVELRAAIEERLGAAVVTARPAGGGFTRGFAAVLETAAGDRAFVKAADLSTQRYLADAYYHEVLITTALPDAVPAPRSRWSLAAAGWYAICLEAVDGAMPGLPWSPADLTATLEAWAAAAQALQEPPAELTALDLPRLPEILRTELSSWQAIQAGRAPMPPGSTPGHDRLATAHLPDLAALEATLPGYVESGALTHCDLRLDNVLIDRAGSASWQARLERGGAAGDTAAWICDWNWLCHGAPWFDTAVLLVTAYASGEKTLAGSHSDRLHVTDADRLFAAHPTAADAPPDALDASLATIGGFWLSQANGEPSDASPLVRTHQQWSGETALAWLASRQGWR
jgi:hypothetical protein